MDNNKVNIVNGAVVGIHLGAPMQDATPDRPEDNEAYATERNTETRLPNSNTEENLEKQPEPSAGGVSSWNDLTDKPFYKSEETLLDGTFEFVDAGGMHVCQSLDNSFALDVGQSYTVIWDGVAYQRTVDDFDRFIVLGNKLMVGGADTGEPFTIAANGGVYVIGTLETAATHTVKVSAEPVDKINPDCLPEGYPSKKQKVLFEGSGIAFGTNDHINYFANIDRIYFSGVGIIAGQKYTVIWDGVEYADLIAFNSQGVPMLGADLGNTNDEMPFCAINDGGELVLTTHSDEATHSVSIFSETIHTMSPEFLPEPLVLYVMEV